MPPSHRHRGASTTWAINVAATEPARLFLRGSFAERLGFMVVCSALSLSEPFAFLFNVLNQLTGVVKAGSRAELQQY